MHAAEFIAVGCHDICKVFGSGSGQVKALRGINLNVQEGELMMLVRP